DRDAVDGADRRHAGVGGAGDPALRSGGLRPRRGRRAVRARARPARLRRRVRIAHRRHVLFSHSILVRSPVPARLYGGRAHGVRQRAPPSERPGELEGPDLFMKAAKKKNEEARPAERNRFSRALDSGETRAIILAAAFLFVFFYFIRLILLP